MTNDTALQILEHDSYEYNILETLHEMFIDPRYADLEVSGDALTIAKVMWAMKGHGKHSAEGTSTRARKAA
jgi:hypothetical protein